MIRDNLLSYGDFVVIKACIQKQLFNVCVLTIFCMFLTHGFVDTLFFSKNLMLLFSTLVALIIDKKYNSGVVINMLSKEKKNNLNTSKNKDVKLEVVIIRLKNKKIYLFFKRFFDILLSFLGLVILSWLFLIIAILVKVTSKGPIIYSSIRVGKNGKEFKFYKFRSMKVNADKELDDLLKYNETNGITFKMKNDPRITKFGKFLRKTSLDELPQLFNILNGSMSIVGPRPALPREVALYNDYQRQRLLVKQGLTCIWQCSGRSNTTFDEQVNMDLNYINKRGFFFDIWIIIKTVFAVLFHKGAE